MSDFQSVLPILLFFGGIGCGMIASISGGAALVIMPTFLFLGLSPLQAVATQNLFSVPAQTSAGLYFWRKGHVPKDVLRLAPVACCMGALGAFSVGALPAAFLKAFLPFILIGIALWVAFNPTLQPRKRGTAWSVARFGLCALPFFSFYDGFLGVCSTTFYTFAYLVLRQRNVVEATAVAKVFTACSSSAAIFIFISGGNLVWEMGIPLALGGMVGAQIGSRLVVSHGVKIVRLVVIVVSVASSAKLLFDHDLWTNVGRFFAEYMPITHFFVA